MRYKGTFLDFSSDISLAFQAGHRGLSPNGFFCDLVGYVSVRLVARKILFICPQLCHTLALTPYWSWKISHHRHHMTHGSLERDELWMPATRSELNLPPPPEDHESIYEEYFSDSPIYGLIKLLSFHFFAFQAYLSKSSPFLVWHVYSGLCLQFGTSRGESRTRDGLAIIIVRSRLSCHLKRCPDHRLFTAYSEMYRESQRGAIVLSDIGIAATLYLVWKLSPNAHDAMFYYCFPGSA